jgi:transducin (beta)-like 1
VDTKQVMIANSTTENPLTHTIKLIFNCHTVAWNSHNQLACGYDDGTFEIHEIKLNNSQMKSRIVQKIRHDLDDDGPKRYFFINDFQMKTQNFVTSIARNEKLNLLASGGIDRRVKVF